MTHYSPITWLILSMYTSSLMWQRDTSPTEKEEGKEVIFKEKVLRRLGQHFSGPRVAADIFAMCLGNSALRFATLLHESKLDS